MYRAGPQLTIWPRGRDIAHEQTTKASQEIKNEGDGGLSLYRPRGRLRLRIGPQARHFRSRPLRPLGNIVPEPPGSSSLMVVQRASSPSPCSVGLRGCSASAPCRAWHARAARRGPPTPGPAETWGRPGRSQPAPRRALPSAAPAGAASPAAAAAGAEATPPFRPPRGRGRRRARPGLSLAPAAPPPRSARPPPPPGRPPGSSPRPGAVGTGNRKCAAPGGAATYQGRS